MSTRRLHTIFRHVLWSKSQTVGIPNGVYARMQYQAAALPSVIAEPRVALYDEQIKISLKGFPSNEKVTLHGQFVQGQKKIMFASCGHYTTDNTGQVNIWQQSSIGGTYTGFEPMGILWSLQPAPGYPPNTRMAINFTEKPTVIQLQTYKGHLQLEDIYQSPSKPSSLACVQLERWFRFPEVTRIEVEDGNIRASLFLPPGEGPFQGVIDLFGSAGGIIEYRAALLASRGFATLSLPYFRYKDLPKDFADTTLDYFEEAVNWLCSHPKVFPYGIGVVAVSKGVEYTYSMTTNFDKVKCAVCINGLPYMGISDLYYKGKVLYKASIFDIGLGEMTDEGLVIKPALTYDNNVIPSWQGNAKHLILLSEDDYQMDPDIYNVFLEACLQEKKENYEIVRYPGAGHLLEPPYTALCRTAVNPTFQIVMLFGGKRKEHAHAQEDSWQRILNHLRKNIPTKP